MYKCVFCHIIIKSSFTICSRFMYLFYVFVIFSQRIYSYILWFWHSLDCNEAKVFQALFSWFNVSNIAERGYFVIFFSYCFTFPKWIQAHTSKNILFFVVGELTILNKFYLRRPFSVHGGSFSCFFLIGIHFM